MTSSLSNHAIYNKENSFASQSLSLYRPAHQGKAFKIDLGYSNGPFLSKDVMHSNSKSASLLAAKEILQSHMSMSNMMGVLTKQQENQATMIRSTFKVENWFSRCEFLEGELSYLSKQSAKLSNEQKTLKCEIKSSFEKLIKQSQQMASGFLPLFKGLLKTIRQQSHGQQNEYEQKRRDIEDLTKFRNSYLDQLVQCQKRIMDSQDVLGINQNSNFEETI